MDFTQICSTYCVFVVAISNLIRVFIKKDESRKESILFNLLIIGIIMGLFIFVLIMNMLSPVVI